MAELTVTLPDGRQSHHALSERDYVIGRDAACDIALDDPSASRRHARISPTPHGFLIEDLGSKNGTLVNDAPCTSKLLKNGDRVHIGAALVMFHAAADTTTAPSVVVAEDAHSSHATRYVGRDQQLVLPQRRLEMIYALSSRLTALQGQDQLLENAMDICFETLGFERGAVAIRRRGSRALAWPVVRNLRGAQGEITISRTLLSRALEHGERAVFTDDGGGNTDPTVSMVQHGIRSAMCVPLSHQDKTLGVIYGDRTSTSTPYTDEDIDFLAGIAHHVTIGLINSRLVEDQQQMLRLNHDIDLARTIQTGLFPKALPDRDGFRVAAINDPGQGVSGDYYDVIELDDGRAWCLVADVTGEGVAAALLMANLQAAVRVSIADSDDPAHHLRRWNALIHANTDSSKFITGVLALIDPALRRIKLASAGHPHPILVGADGSVREMDVDPGFPLGVVAEADYATADVALTKEPATYVCYSDGVIEAMNSDRKMYGLGRLLAALSEASNQNPRPLVKHIRKEVSTFTAAARQSDDITVLAARLG